MPVRTADAQWDGSLTEGDGRMAFGGGAFEGQYSFGSRFEEGDGTNPEELIAAAHAGCFSMQLAGVLGKEGYEPESVSTTARIHLDKDGEGFTITRSELASEANVGGIEEEEFQRIADEAKRVCPVSRALGAIEIGLEAKLAS
ncbi:MAG: OsmC family protein [Solirubrobacterales bacterium]